MLSPLNGRIAMAGGDAHALPGQHRDDFESRVALRRKRDHSRQAIPRIEQALHGINIRGSNCIGWMRATKPLGFIDERPLDVKPRDELSSQRIAIAQAYQIRQARAHFVEVFRDDRRQDRFDVVLLKHLTSAMQRVGREIILIEIATAVAVDLKIDECCHWGRCHLCSIWLLRRLGRIDLQCRSRWVN
jgi:hypothetical protein